MEKSLRKAAIKLLNNGMTKEAVLDQLQVDFNHRYSRMEIVKVLRYLPSREQRRKYGVYNMLILGLLIVIDLWCLMKLSYGSLVWLGVLTYHVATQRTNYYYWISVFGAFVVIMGIAVSLYRGVTGSMEVSSFVVILSSTVLGGIFILFGYLFPKYYTPDYDDSGSEEFTAADGSIQVRKKIRFN